MRVTCPHCDSDFPLEAGFTDADGKRLAALLAEFEPALGRATLSYLRLFKPLKTALRTARAVRLVQELEALVRAGTVCRDERGGVRRPASPAIWTAGIDQMFQQRERLELPLENHNYLRKVVFALADAADAKAEQDREAGARARRPDGPSPRQPAETRLANHLAWLRQQLAIGQLTEDAYKAQCAEARETLGGENGGD